VKKYIADKNGNFVEHTQVTEFDESMPIPRPPYEIGSFDPEIIARLEQQQIPVSESNLKQEFSIHFRVVGSDWIGSRITPQGPQDSNKFEITLDESQVKKMDIDPLAVMTHEIGHALAYLAGLPGNKRSMFMEWGKQTPWGKWDAEVEAWDAAEKVFKATREKCLESYRPLSARPLEFGDKA
jgi:hypothetical protein